MSVGSALDVPPEQLEAAVAAIRSGLEPEPLVAVALYGSAVAGGLRPDSDLDVLVLVARRLDADEKRDLVARLRPISRRALRPAGWRPLEVTVVATPDVSPWRYPPILDLQYGEWLSDDELEAAIERGATASADLAVVLAMARASGRALIGPAAADLLDPVPDEDLERAMVDEIPSLLDDLESDTRNVLLTLARIWSTLASGRIRSKDAAAEWALSRLDDQHRPLLARARDRYRAGGWGEWDRDAARALADELVARIAAAR